MVLFLGIGPPFVNPGVCPSGQHLDSHLEEASSQWSASILLGGALPLSGSCPLGWGDDVGDCHDVTNLPRMCLFISLVFHCGEKTTLFFQGKVSCISLPLGMLVAKREPAPCYHDAYSVGTPNGAFGGKAGKNTVRPWVLPSLDVSFW